MLGAGIQWRLRTYLLEEDVGALLDVAVGVDGGVGRREGVLDPHSFRHFPEHPTLFVHSGSIGIGEVDTWVQACRLLP